MLSAGSRAARRKHFFFVVCICVGFFHFVFSLSRLYCSTLQANPSISQLCLPVLYIPWRSSQPRDTHMHGGVEKRKNHGEVYVVSACFRGTRLFVYPPFFGGEVDSFSCAY